MARIHGRRIAVFASCTVLLVGSRVSHGQQISRNLLYTSLPPCRVIDTRSSTAGKLLANVTQTFNVVGDSSDFSSQGGSAVGCHIPGFNSSNAAQVQAVVFNLIAVGSSGPGDLLVWPTDQPQPLSSSINFANSAALSGLNIANGIVLPVRQDQQGGDISVRSQVSTTHFVADVVGYFSSGSTAPVAPATPNVFLGAAAGNSATVSGQANVAIGTGALEANTTGGLNTAIGSFALSSLTVGSDNIGIGANALGSVTTGNFNLAIGRSAGGAGGSSNIALGADALEVNVGNGNVVVGSSAATNLVSGSSNIVIGASAGFQMSGSESGDIYIAHGGVAGENNTIRIGSTSVTYNGTIIEGIAGMNATGGDAVFITSGGRLGTVTSSLRFKKDVEDLGDRSNVLMQLRPVTFHYKENYGGDDQLRQFGLIAEEVAEVDPELVQYDDNGWPNAVRYHLINAMLLNEVQQQHRQGAEQRREIAAQRAQIARQQEEMDQQRQETDRQRLETDRQRQEMASQKERIEHLERLVAQLAAGSGGH